MQKRSGRRRSIVPNRLLTVRTTFGRENGRSEHASREIYCVHNFNHLFISMHAGNWRVYGRKAVVSMP